ncbi:hypothetical protein DVH24_019363 [Malus domestica]|uniref:Reverse transcriptase zinc-binding domain-containing protein n=1 Tax=Malus domestica TaxID=3750 RepID=A0A498I355_MALDO|nr:hypothetical protein DVH24_019363 [Malus domestica]
MQNETDNNGTSSQPSTTVTSNTPTHPFSSMTTMVHIKLDRSNYPLWLAQIESLKFYRRCCLNTLPTRANLKRRKIITTENCLSCDGDPEGVEHTLLECPRSASIWFSSPLCLRMERHIHVVVFVCGWLRWISTANPKLGCRNLGSGTVSRNAAYRQSLKKWEKPDVGWLKCKFGCAWDELGELGGIGVVIEMRMVLLWQVHQ